MGIVNLYRSKWNTRIGKREVVWNGLIASHTFLNELVFKKSRTSFECAICNKEKPKNTRYIGDSYEKICPDCYGEWFENSNKALQEIQMILKKSKEDLELNKDKWK